MRLLFFISLSCSIFQYSSNVFINNFEHVKSSTFEEITLLYSYLFAARTRSDFIVNLEHVIAGRVYAAAVISLQFMNMKKISNASIFVFWLSTSLYFGDSVRYIHVNFKFRCFPAYYSRPLKQSRLDFSNTKQSIVRIQLLEIDCGRSLFLDISCAKRE